MSARDEEVASESPVGSGALKAEALFERLAERLGATAKAAVIYGEVVERDGVTVIPVAKAKWGLGGGGGSGQARGGRHGSGEGLGGGGGVTVRPVGYIEIRGGCSRFRPIWDPAKAAVLGLAGTALLLLLLRPVLRRRR